MPMYGLVHAPEKSGMDACPAASAANPAQRRPVNVADARSLLPAVANMHLLLQYSCDRLLSIIFFPFSAFGRSARGDDGSPSAQATISGSTIVAPFYRSIALTARAEPRGNALRGAP